MFVKIDGQPLGSDCATGVDLHTCPRAVSPVTRIGGIVLGSTAMTREGGPEKKE